MRQIDFEWNKTVHWPSIFIFDGRPFPFLVLGIFFDFFMNVWLALFIIFLITKITKTPIAVYLRRLKAKFVGRTLHGYPLNKQHGLMY